MRLSPGFWGMRCLAGLVNLSLRHHRGQARKSRQARAGKRGRSDVRLLGFDDGERTLAEGVDGEGGIVCRYITSGSASGGKGCLRCG